ncbi:hypothetical protein MSAN_01731400 [Mycena sanguinolenta]|uniref:Uncharacterized protein n=1 Tax=Mycena sanguinolenta TaxID=230812 RepID=A0A8H6Y079_9AGAR|nr:hypothetical protein MSAN_01731400 [Mycena sanguinolenta]
MILLYFLPWQFNPTSPAGSFHAGAPWQPGRSAPRWSQNAINASPWIAYVDALANGVDTVSAAFLQLVEFHERSQLDKSLSDLLRSSLSNGYVAPEDLLSVVDWGRLRNLAVSRVFPPLSTNPLGYLEGHELQLPNQTTSRDFQCNRPLRRGETSALSIGRDADYLLLFDSGIFIVHAVA